MVLVFNAFNVLATGIINLSLYLFIIFIIYVHVSDAGKLAVMDLVEVNPELGSSEDQAKTLNCCNKIVSGWFNSGTLHNRVNTQRDRSTDDRVNC